MSADLELLASRCEIFLNKYQRPSMIKETRLTMESMVALINAHLSKEKPTQTLTLPCKWDQTPVVFEIPEHGEPIGRCPTCNHVFLLGFSLADLGVESIQYSTPQTLGINVSDGISTSEETQ